MIHEITHKAAAVTATYTYTHNLQGDITGMVDSDGRTVVSYSYDAWGKPTGTSTLTSEYDDLASMNPFRYRGYVWDEETGLYYLRSRYYNAGIGRMISSDVQIDMNSLLGLNSYTYCGNNFVIMFDSSGKESSSSLIEWHTIFYKKGGSGHHYLRIGRYAFSWEHDSKLHYQIDKNIKGKSTFIKAYAKRSGKTIIGHKKILLSDNEGTAKIILRNILAILNQKPKDMDSIISTIAKNKEYDFKNNSMSSESSFFPKYNHDKSSCGDFSSLSIYCSEDSGTIKIMSDVFTDLYLTKHEHFYYADTMTELFKDLYSDDLSDY